jgi:hypothetical protein
MAHKYKLIACDIIYRELCWLLATTPHIVDVQFMKKGLHDMGAPKMSSLLQEALDAAPKGEYEAILLGYGLCGNGIQGLHCHLPLVVPRCHDCITLLLGSRKRYRRFFDEHPGTYFRSTGWIEREHPELLEDGRLDSTMTQLGLSSINYAELIEKYGEENAQYILETLGGEGGTAKYDTLCYLEAPFGDFSSYEQGAREEAARKGWTFQKEQADLILLKKLLWGEWNEEDFLIVPPGEQIAPVYNDAEIIRCDRCN